MIATNVQCLKNKTRALQTTVGLEDADVICISEHWLVNDNADLYQLHGYRTVSCFCRSESGHGGVSIMVSEGTEATELTYIKEAALEKDCELVGIHLPIYNIIVVSLYRTPTGNIENFISTLEDVLTQIQATNSTKARIILAGDTNIFALTTKIKNC